MCRVKGLLGIVGFGRGLRCVGFGGCARGKGRFGFIAGSQKAGILLATGAAPCNGLPQGRYVEKA